MKILRSLPSPSSESAGARFLIAATVLLVTAALTAGCGGPEPGGAGIDPATADSLLADLTGTVGSSMQTEQRWRLVASLGAGLPPEDYRRAELPESGSHAVALLEAYCVQCHWIPSPEMHSAQEWPILIRRMEMRSRTLQKRLRGEMAERVMGEMMMAGMGHSIVPSAAEQDTILRYVQRNALPVVDRESLGESEGATLYADVCTRCHQTPDPAAHTVEEWRDEVIPRMQSNMVRMGLEQLTSAERRSVMEFLETRSGS